MSRKGVPEEYDWQPGFEGLYLGFADFCSGGLSRGFIDAGFSVKLGVDFDDMALKTFAANHEGAVAKKLDLFDLDNVDKIKEFFDENKSNTVYLVFISYPIYISLYT